MTARLCLRCKTVVWAPQEVCGMCAYDLDASVDTRRMAETENTDSGPQGPGSAVGVAETPMTSLLTLTNKLISNSETSGCAMRQAAPALMLRTAPSFTVAAVPVSIRIARRAL